MFGNCNNLESVQLSNFEVQNVESMLGMFHKCNSMTNLSVPNFNTENLEEASYLLSDCEKLQYIDFSKFNTIKLEGYENITKNLPEKGTLICNKNIFNLSAEFPSKWTIQDKNE